MGQGTEHLRYVVVPSPKGEPLVTEASSELWPVCDTVVEVGGHREANDLSAGRYHVRLGESRVVKVRYGSAMV